jgi:crossover junction endodeoxyribonuclease RuvC
MLVVGIDPGIATTGYGFIRPSSSGRLEAVDFGVLRTDAGAPLPERLACLYQGLTNLLLRHRPDAAAVERLYFQRNVTTAMVVGEARGVLLLALAQAGVSVGEYTPGEIKQAITAYGSARKPQMQEMIRLLFGLAEVPRPDDAADALAVAVCHLQRAGLEQRVGGSG